MLRRESTSKLHINESAVSISLHPQCREGEEQCHNIVPDVETGLELTSNDNHLSDIPLNNEEDVADTGQCHESTECYTHIQIPCPGHGIGLSPPTPKPTKNDKPKRGIFVRRKDKDKKMRNEPENDTIDHPPESEQSPQQVMKRDVPVHCAICLMEYTPTERICWSSNPECTHVFHEDCIMNWLIYCGRIKSKLVRSPVEGCYTEEQLLNYKLECPCCRQEFVWKEAVKEVDESEE